MPKSASFDVLGTCFEFEPAIEVIRARLSKQLSSRSLDATTLCFSWFFAAQRDFTYTSLCDSYTPIAKILQCTFKRACAVVGIPLSEVSDEDVAAVMKAVKSLSPRPYLKYCFDALREAGWDVYAVTNGGKETSLGYYFQAGIALDEDHLLSCDDIKVAKPDARVYARTNEYLTERKVGIQGYEDRWFVAAHAWDLLAARKAGFKTAYLRFEEWDGVEEVFGEFDIVADDMEDLLKKMSNV
jgi:2-haloacid dehalogenase